VNLISPEE